MATSSNRPTRRGGSHFSTPSAPEQQPSAARVPEMPAPSAGTPDSAVSSGASTPRPVMGTASVSSRTAAATRRATKARAAGGHQRLSQQQRRSRAPRVAIALLGTLVLAAVVAFVVVPALFPSAQDQGAPHVEAGTEVTITIPDGSGATVIAQILYENGLIEDQSEFLSQVRRTEAEQSLKSGSYLIVAGSDLTSIINLLTSGPNASTALLTVPEGYTVTQVAAAVESSLGIPASDFLAQAKASNYVSEYAFLVGAGEDSLEGYLFPKTYDFSAETNLTADLVIRALLNQYQTELASLDLDAAAAALSERYGITLTADDVLTVASIVEREALNDEQRATIASVFYNRLAADMPLQSDATLTYSLGHAPSAEELQTSDDPYNTYSHNGLTPTPICSPSLASIQAAANPEDTTYYYFYITEDTTQFSESYEDHQQAYS